MKQYFNSLFPYRWILILIFECLMLLILIIGKQLTNNNSFYNTLILCNIPFWFIIDFIFGIGQRNYWDRNK